MPAALPLADLEVLVARWGQSVRFSLGVVEGVAVGMAHAHALPVSADSVIAAMMLTADTINGAP